jgi:hypothetical protein
MQSAETGLMEGNAVGGYEMDDCTRVQRIHVEVYESVVDGLVNAQV